MPGVTTFLDSCALINAFRGSEESATKLLRILEDPDRDFISSSIVKLEVLPKPTTFRNHVEVEFYNLFFSRVTRWIQTNEPLISKALEYGCSHGLGPLDSLHVAAALEGQVREFITDERATKPFFQVVGLSARRFSDLT